MDQFYYNKQMTTYLTQFMAIFSGMQCQVGKSETKDERLISVPVHYGNKDRVVAHILSDNTQNKPIRLPVISAKLTSINLAPELRKGVGTERRNTYLPRGGLFPDDIQNVKQLMPVPYLANADISIYVSNTDQRFQILEQIMMLFDPSVQIQTSDATFDWTKLTTVELENITLEDNYPVGTDRRMLISTLSFKFPVYISAPSNIRTDYIKDIMVRIGIGTGTPEETLQDLDDQGVAYENIFSIDDININE